MNNKYKLVCTKCGKVIEDFAQWFEMNQQCDCGCKRADDERPVMLLHFLQAFYQYFF